jgi:hypothetical protein
MTKERALLERREAIIRARAQELAHSLDQGEQEAMRALLNTTRTQNQPPIRSDQALHWLAASALPVRIYDSGMIEVRLAPQMEVPALIEAAHKFLSQLDHFLSEKKETKKS